MATQLYSVGFKWWWTRVVLVAGVYYSASGCVGVLLHR